jgi:putative transposase
MIDREHQLLAPPRVKLLGLSLAEVYYQAT